jgi:hypothetical protein
VVQLPLRVWGAMLLALGALAATNALVLAWVMTAGREKGD